MLLLLHIIMQPKVQQQQREGLSSLLSRDSNSSRQLERPQRYRYSYCASLRITNQNLILILKYLINHFSENYQQKFHPYIKIPDWPSG